MGRLDEAIQLHHKYLDVMFSELGCDMVLEADAYEKLARCYLQMKQFDQFLVFTPKKLHIMTEMRDNSQIHQIYHTLVTVY